MSEENEKYTPGDKINVDYDLPPNAKQAEALREGTLDGLCDEVLDEIADLKQIVFMQSSSHIRRQLFELPDDIMTQSLKLAELTNHIEALGLSIAQSRSQALELVLSTTETDMGKTKQKFSNPESRKVALESILRDDKLYLDNIDELSRKECELRKGQIQLDYLHNQFRAYLAVAGMQGVR
ncbi:MAG: hypothetical protein V1854_05670 [Methanobacteriota archaeon]